MVGARWTRTLSWTLGAVTVVIVLASVVPLAAQEYQFWKQGEGRYSEPLRKGMPDYLGGFMLCRLQYTSVRNEAAGLGWSTDYPRGDQNLLVRLSQLSTTTISHWNDWTPGHTVVKATDPELFRCPFLFTSDAGTAGFTDEEVLGLREYFQKGGFLWVDDFWGDTAFQHWVGQIQRVLPSYEVVEIEPDHALMSLSYKLERVPQIPNIGYWRRANGDTSERGEETRHAGLYAIFDERGRLLVAMTHNTDIADGWEREGESDEFFAQFSPHAYGLAINIALWNMTR